MLKTVFYTLIAFSFISTSFANEKMICSAFYARDLAKVIERENRSDKFKHCAVSCMLTLRCGRYDVYSIGLAKEFLDLLGMGTPEMEDLRANKYGINLVTNAEATNDEDCIKLCSLRY